VRRIPLVLLLVPVALVAVAGAAAHLDQASPYTHLSCPGVAQSRTDPVNVVFHGWGTWGRAQSQVASHAGWDASSGAGQVFVDHGACSPQHAQRASGEGSRYHVRIRGQHWSDALGWAAAGAAHHEDLVLFPFPCGHAVDANGPAGSGFDQGRDELVARLAAAGHGSFRTWWGNTQSFRQCDGDYAASDGWVAFVVLHRMNH
jgi:hypothetical protein